MKNNNRFAQKAFTVLLTIALILPGCGGGGGGGGSRFPRLPALLPIHAKQAPIVFGRSGVQVGADVKPEANLPAVGEHADAAISYGHVRDGISAERVVEYLRELYYFPVSLMRRYQPIVRIHTSSDPLYTEYAIRAVQFINQHLPYDMRIQFASEPFDWPLWISENISVDNLPEGSILVHFTHRESWPQDENTPHGVLGLTDTRGHKSIVWVDPRETNLLRTTAHELLHAIGILGHTSLRSIMNVGRDRSSNPSGHVLFPLDQQALTAAHTLFDEEDNELDDYTVERMGAWTDISTHIRGDLDDVSFGAAYKNGLPQAWASGPSPTTHLSDNQALSGTVSWVGRLLGFTPQAQAVAGATDLTISLATLRGQIDFTGLEHWSVNATPGPVGSGQTWNDGDLGYSVIVRGNTFTQTGGDAGEVTGAFFGAVHEGMGGVVERSDMSAGFGGTR